MVAGKVKAAMGFQKTPPRPKPESPRHFPSPSTEKATPFHKTIFSRSFGVYFPRSTQVQPKPPDVTELLRLVDELQEKESRLKTEILQHKLLKETAAIVPFLESAISSKNAEIECSARRVESLEAENEMLRREVESLKESIGRERTEKEKKMKEMEDEIAELRRSFETKADAAESKGSWSKTGEIEECSSCQRLEGLIEPSEKSNLLMNSKEEVKSTDIDSNQENEKLEIMDLKVDDAEKEEIQQTPTDGEISQPAALCSLNPPAPRIPKPPPKPSSSSLCSVLYPACGETREVGKSRASVELVTRTKFPPLPPRVPAATGEGAHVPPPPPPPPPRVSRTSATKVRRVPEVVELYHSLMRRDSKREASAGISDVPVAANARNMIGEIENRSAHLIAVSLSLSGFISMC